MTARLLKGITVPTAMKQPHSYGIFPPNSIAPTRGQKKLVKSLGKIE